MKSEFNSHVKTPGKNWCRQEFKPGLLAQSSFLDRSTHWHFTSAFDRSMNQITLTSVSVPSSSDLINPKIMELR
jgi:hypothetical protein